MGCPVHAGTKRDENNDTLPSIISRTIGPAKKGRGKYEKTNGSRESELQPVLAADEAADSLIAF